MTKKVTQGIFDAVKLLLSNGATFNEIKKYFDISNPTISVINHSETIEDYFNALQTQAERKAKRRRVAAIKAKENGQEEEHRPEPQVIEHRQTVTVQATWQMTQEMQKTNELLKQISNKLAFIVDELCGVKSNAESDN